MNQKQSLSLSYFLLFLTSTIFSQPNGNRIQGHVITIEGLPIENVTVSFIKQNDRSKIAVTSDSTEPFVLKQSF